MARTRQKTLFSVYRGDELLVTGTNEECARYIGVSCMAIKQYATPSRRKIFKKRAERKKRPVFAVYKIGAGDMTTAQMMDIEEIEVEEQPTAERGKLLNVFGVIGEDGLHHKAAFVLSRGRSHKDLLTVLEQEKRSKKARLSKYGQSLYDSCFQNW